MTPAEKEALEKYADKATPGPWTYQEDSDAYTHIVREGNVINPHGWVCSAGQSSSQQTEDTARYIAAASPDKIKSLLSDLASMEVTLGNATSLAEFQAARIAKFEECLQDNRTHCFHEVSPSPDCQRIDELLSPPPEVKEKI